MRTMLLGLLLAAATGCASEQGQEEEDALVIDPAFSAEEEREIREGIAGWNAVAKPWDGRGWRIEVGTSPPGQNGMCYGKRKTIVVPHHGDMPSSHPSNKLRDFAILVRHELGHARGLEHTCTDGVMQKCEGWLGPSSSAITEGDIAECRRVGACD